MNKLGYFYSRDGMSDDEVVIEASRQLDNYFNLCGTKTARMSWHFLKEILEKKTHEITVSKEAVAASLDVEGFIEIIKHRISETQQKLILEEEQKTDEQRVEEIIEGQE